MTRRTFSFCSVLFLFQLFYHIPKERACWIFEAPTRTEETHHTTEVSSSSSPVLSLHHHRRDSASHTSVVRVTKSRCFPFDDDHPVVNDDVNDDDDFDERGFGTTGGIGHMHHL